MLYNARNQLKMIIIIIIIIIISSSNSFIHSFIFRNSLTLVKVPTRQGYTLNRASH